MNQQATVLKKFNIGLVTDLDERFKHVIEFNVRI